MFETKEAPLSQLGDQLRRVNPSRIFLELTFPMRSRSAMTDEPVPASTSRIVLGTICMTALFLCVASSDRVLEIYKNVLAGRLWSHSVASKGSGTTVTSSKRDAASSFLQGTRLDEKKNK